VDAAEPRDGGGGLPAWLPPLPVASAIVATALVLAWAAASYAGALASAGARGTDFAQYYVAARLTLAHGWAAPYDVAGFMAALRELTGHRDAYANTPVPTFLAMPFTRLPLNLAYAVWNVLLVSLFVAACWVAAPGRGWARVAQLLTSLVALEVLSAIGLGQIALAVAALLVLHWWLLRQGRPVLAGIALGLAFAKPQDVFLVPFALLLTGRRTAAIASAVTAAGLAGACLLVLGADGARAYVRAVAFEMHLGLAGHHTLGALLPPFVPALAVAAVPAALGLVVTLDRRQPAPERPLVAAVLASQLATPYLNGADLALLAPCAWLTIRSGVPRWLAVVVVAANLVPALQDSPVPSVAIGMELVWLAALAALALDPRRRRSTTPDTAG
jgi:hypothetical protein